MQPSLAQPLLGAAWELLQPSELAQVVGVLRASELVLAVEVHLLLPQLQSASKTAWPWEEFQQFLWEP